MVFLFCRSRPSTALVPGEFLRLTCPASRGSLAPRYCTKLHHLRAVVKNQVTTSPEEGTAWGGGRPRPLKAWKRGRVVEA